MMAVSILVTVPADVQKRQAVEKVLALVRHALEASHVAGATVVEVPPVPPPALVPLMVIGPQQLNSLDDTHATVTYPVGSTTVLSVQPNGTVETRDAGTHGIYETALVQPDRLVFAPQGVAGAAFVIPFAAELPHE